MPWGRLEIMRSLPSLNSVPLGYLSEWPFYTCAFICSYGECHRKGVCVCIVNGTSLQSSDPDVTLPSVWRWHSWKVGLAHYEETGQLWTSYQIPRFPMFQEQGGYLVWSHLCYVRGEVWVHATWPAMLALDPSVTSGTDEIWNFGKSPFVIIGPFRGFHEYIQHDSQGKGKLKRKQDFSNLAGAPSVVKFLLPEGFGKYLCKKIGFNFAPTYPEYGGENLTSGFQAVLLK